MVKYLTIILILSTFAQHQEAKDSAKDLDNLKALGKSILGRGAQKLIKAFLPYTGFLENPKIIVDLFEIVTGIELSDNNDNANINNRITSSLDSISSKVNTLSRNMRYFESELLSTIVTNQQHDELKDALNEFYHGVNIVDNYYKRYLRMIETPKNNKSAFTRQLITKLKSFDDKGVLTPLDNLHIRLAMKEATGMNIPMYYSHFRDLVRILFLHVVS